MDSSTASTASSAATVERQRAGRSVERATVRRTALAGPVRVVVVDDQTIVRRAIRTWLGTRPDIEVVGEAADGESALASCHDCVRTYRLERDAARRAGYRRLAIAMLGLDVETPARGLRVDAGRVNWARHGGRL